MVESFFTWGSLIFKKNYIGCCSRLLNVLNYPKRQKYFLLHFLAFFLVASLLSTAVDNKKVGIDNKVASLVTRHDDLATSDKCQVTESNSEGFS